MPENIKELLQPIVNIYIVGSNGITIGDQNNVGQSYSVQSDISEWTDNRKLALAYLTGFINEIPYLPDEGSIEFVNLEIAEYLDENLGRLQKNITSSRERLRAELRSTTNQSNTEAQKLSLSKVLSDISQALDELTKKSAYKQAFENLQSKLEKRGAPQKIVYRYEELPIDTKDLLELAKVYSESDKRDQAIEILKRYLKENPDSIDGQALIMDCFVFLRKYSDAISWNNACPDKSKNPAFRCYLIAAYKNAGDYENARKEMNKFVSDFSDHPNARAFQKMTRGE
jgi:tetratricopeptide (TPR) repeat protein